jgi:hypothetical protein
MPEESCRCRKHGQQQHENNLFDLNVQIKDGAWLFLLNSLPLMPPSQVNTQ